MGVMMRRREKRVGIRLLLKRRLDRDFDDLFEQRKWEENKEDKIEGT